MVPSQQTAADDCAAVTGDFSQGKALRLWPAVWLSSSGANTQKGIKQWPTLFSMIMDLEKGAIYIAEAYPCQNEYYKLTPQILLKH